MSVLSVLVFFLLTLIPLTLTVGDNDEIRPNPAPLRDSAELERSNNE